MVDLLGSFYSQATATIDWPLFTSTFALIFVAELPDKTALSTVLLATRNNPIAVFLGAAGAFAIQSAVAVAFGKAFSYLPERPVHVASGILFLVFAIFMWRRREDDGAESSVAGHTSGRRRFLTGSATAFIVIFIAEWGDLTQLATATLVAKYHSTLTIFLSSVLSLWSVTALAIVVGHKSKQWINPIALQKTSAILMAVVGLYFLLRL